MKTDAPDRLSRPARVFFFLAGFGGTSFLFYLLATLNVTGLRGEHHWGVLVDYYENQRKADAILLAWFALPSAVFLLGYLLRRPRQPDFAQAARIGLAGWGAALLVRGLFLLLPT